MVGLGNIDDVYKHYLVVIEENQQLKELRKRLKDTQNLELEVRRENQQLKELLKECREFFYENLIDTEFHFSCGLGSDIKKQSCIRSLSKLKTKIDNAIGEK